MRDPLYPGPIPPFSISHDSEGQDTSPAKTETMDRFTLPEGTAFLVLPEKRQDGSGPNIVEVGNADRHFLFDPERRLVVFETKAQSGRIMHVELPLSDTNHPQGLHVIALRWSRTRALLGVDEVKAEANDRKPED